MPCNRPELTDYLTNFTGQDPVSAVYCPFVQSSGGGAGMGEAMFALFLFGTIGLGMTIRLQSPAPLVVMGMLGVAVFAAFVPGIAAKIAFIVVMFVVVAAGFVIYQRAQSSL